MPATSPLPGALRSLSPNQHPGGRGLARWLRGAVELEAGDLPGRIAIAASAVAAAFALGGILGDGMLGLFPYRFARLVLYGVSLLSGTIIAAGFLSQSRTARFTAILSTAMIAIYALSEQLYLPPWVFGIIKAGYGIGLLGAVSVAAIRALRRRLELPRNF